MAPVGTERERERHAFEADVVWPGEAREREIADRIERYRMERADDESFSELVIGRLAPQRHGVVARGAIRQRAA